MSSITVLLVSFAILGNAFATGPLVHGFDGSTFRLDGEPGTPYALISSPRNAVNGIIGNVVESEDSWLIAIGLRYKTAALTVSINATADDVELVTVADKVYMRTKSGAIPLRVAFNAMVRDDLLASGQNLVEEGGNLTVFFPVTGAIVQWTTPEFKFVVQYSEHKAMHLDISTEIVGAGLNGATVDGLIGRTLADQNGRSLVASQPSKPDIADYDVDSLYGIEFASSKFLGVLHGDANLAASTLTLEEVHQSTIPTATVTGKERVVNIASVMGDQPVNAQAKSLTIEEVHEVEKAKKLLPAATVTSEQPFVANVNGLTVYEVPALEMVKLATATVTGEKPAIAEGSMTGEQQVAAQAQSLTMEEVHEHEKARLPSATVTGEQPLEARTLTKEEVDAMQAAYTLTARTLTKEEVDAMQAANTLTAHTLPQDEVHQQQMVEAWLKDNINAADKPTKPTFVQARTLTLEEVRALEATKGKRITGPVGEEPAVAAVGMAGVEPSNRAMMSQASNVGKVLTLTKDESIAGHVIGIRESSSQQALDIKAEATITNEVAQDNLDQPLIATVSGAALATATVEGANQRPTAIVLGAGLPTASATGANKVPAATTQGGNQWLGAIVEAFNRLAAFLMGGTTDLPTATTSGAAFSSFPTATISGDELLTFPTATVSGPALPTSTMFGPPLATATVEGANKLPTARVEGANKPPTATVTGANTVNPVKTAKAEGAQLTHLKMGEKPNRRLK